MDMDHDACYRAIESRDVRFDGRLFTGVLTTGVYCRPVCPARTPLRANVVFFPSAAAAQEAGFRPCLRCRPETSPDLGAWRGTSNTVARALRLIEDGALDEAPVAALADRLGVGERQLRRLFRQHLGASPGAVAQTRRVLLAKQLIHDTRLPMAQVALGAGFRSVRRFNEAFQALYAKPPGALRRATATASAIGADEAVRVSLAYRPPMDWDDLLAFLAARAIPGVEMVDRGRYARTLRVGGVVASVVVERASGDRLAATIRAPDLRVLPAIIARVRRVFDLAADPLAIDAHLAQDPFLAPLVAARPGLRAPGAWDGFELAVRAVLGQQITVAAAAELAAKLVRAHGECLVGRPGAGMAPDLAAGLTHLFPTPDRLSGPRDIAALGMPRARAASLTALAEAATAEPRLFAPGGDLTDSITRLRRLPGVGEWTAQYIAMRELREPDAFPAADVGLMRAVANQTGARPTAAELLARAERWRPWRAYAALHLWASLPNAPARSGRPADDRHAA